MSYIIVFNFVGSGSISEGFATVPYKQGKARLPQCIVAAHMAHIYHRTKSTGICFVCNVRTVCFLCAVWHSLDHNACVDSYTAYYFLFHKDTRTVL